MALAGRRARSRCAGGRAAPGGHAAAGRRPRPERRDALAWAAQRANDALAHHLRRQARLRLLPRDRPQRRQFHRGARLPARPLPARGAIRSRQACGARHAPHCHDARHSEKSSDVLLPGIATCVACHGAERAVLKTRSTCTSCHLFHRQEFGPDEDRERRANDAAGPIAATALRRRWPLLSHPAFKAAMAVLSVLCAAPSDCGGGGGGLSGSELYGSRPDHDGAQRRRRCNRSSTRRPTRRPSGGRRRSSRSSTASATCSPWRSHDRRAEPMATDHLERRRRRPGSRIRRSRPPSRRSPRRSPAPISHRAAMPFRPAPPTRSSSSISRSASTATRSGPLFGVQFSQLPCSDFSRGLTGGAPRRGRMHAPLGLAADPGGLPLYINGVLVGGIGVMSTATYSLNPSTTSATATTRGSRSPGRSASRRRRKFRRQTSRSTAPISITSDHRRCIEPGVAAITPPTLIAGARLLRRRRGIGGA